ncbi:MAG TPA: DUF4232 domain-containing protein [Candidatus Limnocylindrales bacterium]
MTRSGPDPSDAYRGAAPASAAGGPDDAFEDTLARRIAGHAEHGVRPIDAAAIARTAASTGAGGRSGSGVGVALGRLGWLLTGAILAAGVIGGTAWAGSHDLLGAAVESAPPSEVAVLPTSAPSPSILIPTAPPTSVPMTACALADLSARVTSWTGAAGNRIATVVLTNTGSGPCTIPSKEQPRLIGGAGKVLLDGDPPASTTAVVVAAGASVSTEIDDANYCGSAPKAPVTVAFVFAGPDGSSSAGVLVAEPRSATDTFGVPECLGPGGPGLITMHPWAP